MINPSSKFQRRVNSKIRKRWQLFHATDFQSLMYPCFAISRILGIFPYKINASIFEASKLYYILLIVIICVTCFYELAKIYEINILKIRNSVAEKIQDNCYNALESFIVIVSLILSGPRMRLLQTVLEVSSKLPPKSYEKLSKLIHVKDIFGFLFIMGQSLSFLYFYETYNGFLATAIIERYIGFQIFQMNMLYVNCVCILKACFKRIDDNLINLRELMINDKSQVPRLIYYQQRNPILLKELKILEKEYLKISDTVQMLNIIFSPQLLAIIAIAFIEITFELYLNMVQWQNGLSINLAKQIHNTFLMSYMMYHVINIILIVWACETGKNQAIKINTTIHDVLNSINDEQIKHEVLKNLIFIYFLIFYMLIHFIICKIYT